MGEPDAGQRVGYLTDLLTERAVDYIRAPHRQPFYLSLHYTAPHAPWEGPEDAAIGHDDQVPGPMTNGGSLADLCVDDEEHGRGHRPRPAGAGAREAWSATRW